MFPLDAALTISLRVGITATRPTVARDRGRARQQLNRHRTPARSAALCACLPWLVDGLNINLTGIRLFDTLLTNGLDPSILQGGGAHRTPPLPHCECALHLRLGHGGTAASTARPFLLPPRKRWLAKTSFEPPTTPHRLQSLRAEPAHSSRRGNYARSSSCSCALDAGSALGNQDP